MKELLPTSFVKRRANKLEAWLVELRKDSRLVSFIARARQTQKAVRSAEKLLTDLPNLRADPKILRSFDDFFVGPGILAVGPRKRVAGRRSAKPPECEHFNIDGLAALHTVAALQYGSRDAWSNVRATLQGIAAATTELHWQVHAAEDWNKLDRAAQTAALAVISRDNQELGVPPELDFLRCPWFREPVIDDLLNWADSIAHEAASFPKCMDGTYSNGAIQRVDPRVACPGDIVRLLGNFPATQDAAVAVLFPTDTGYQAAQIVSWTATMIELRLPPN